MHSLYSLKNHAISFIELALTVRAGRLIAQYAIEPAQH
jgi:hypothetical protein